MEKFSISMIIQSVTFLVHHVPDLISINAYLVIFNFIRVELIVTVVFFLFIFLNLIF
jgi:hypothetical protein